MMYNFYHLLYSWMLNPKISSSCKPGNFSPSDRIKLYFGSVCLICWFYTIPALAANKEPGPEATRYRTVLLDPTGSRLLRWRGDDCLIPGGRQDILYFNCLTVQVRQLNNNGFRGDTDCASEASLSVEPGAHMIIVNNRGKLIQTGGDTNFHNRRVPLLPYIYTSGERIYLNQI